MQRLVTFVVILLGILLLSAGLYLTVLGPAATMTTVSVAAIKPGDQEAAWLHPATNIATWERFVAGLKELPDVSIDDTAAFPEDSMKLPVVGIQYPGNARTLWIRWYKLTGQRNIEQWVNELCLRTPPPMAIVGGGNSERARDIALHLKRLSQKQSVTRLPVFLITTATADKVLHPDTGIIDLMQIYPERSFRYCFTNRQMAEGIHDFVQEHINKDRNLEITSPRISLISWHDDPFSEDLVDQFEEIWRTPTPTSPVPGVWAHRIAHSVGSLNQPNKPEAAAIDKLIKEASSESIVFRGRELLVLPGGPNPSRRVLRTLYRTDPLERHFWVVTVADAIDWNTLYRDRRLTWSIEDVPFTLIAFMHRNPVEQQLRASPGFVSDDSTLDAPNSTGTDDLLLYRDIGLSLSKAFKEVTEENDPANILLRHMRQELDPQGQPLFDDQGNRPGRAGEFITLLRPQYDGQQVLPKSKIEVFERMVASNSWRRVIAIDADYSTNRGKP
ncbi:MAG: hypothetical protein U0796_19475 [Gemmatales bacterium]